MFEDIPTSVISDVLGRSQVMHSEIKPIIDIKKRIEGRAYTVNAMVGCNLGSHLALYYAKKGDIIVIDGKGYKDRAIWGGLQSYIAKERGIKATIIDGAVRDKQEHINLNYCVCARAITPVGPHKGWFDELQASISCGGVVVNPNDTIVIDLDGIVVIPHYKVEETYEKAIKQLDNEKLWRIRVDNGEELYKVLGLNKNVKFFQNRK